MSQEILFRPEVLPFVLGALAIVVFFPIVLVRTFLSHRERMAMIRHGIHPDHPGQEGGDTPFADRPAKMPASKQAAAWSDWKAPQD